MTKKVIGIYLAAGKSTRFHGNKLTVMIAGESLGSMGLKAGLRSNLQHIIVVTQPGDCESWIPPYLRQTYAHKLWITKCKDSIKGQSATLQYSLCIAQQQKADAILIMLADQPFITHHLLNQYLYIYEHSDDYTCIGMKHSYIGPPILITSKLFPQIHLLQGDQGARKIIQKQQKTSYFLTGKSKKYCIDIDTQADLERWFPN